MKSLSKDYVCHHLISSYWSSLPLLSQHPGQEPIPRPKIVGWLHRVDPARFSHTFNCPFCFAPVFTSTWASASKRMAQFWKPGTEKPRLLDDGEGGVLFFSSSYSSSSGYIDLIPSLSVSIAKHRISLHSRVFTFWSLWNRFGFSSIEKQRQRLPVYKYRTAILYLVETHATTIIVGETGSGKTTQIPQVSLYLSLYPCASFFFWKKWCQSSNWSLM